MNIGKPVRILEVKPKTEPREATPAEPAPQREHTREPERVKVPA